MKSAIIRDYYDFWWGITSGGPNKKYCYNTAIIEMNAATGEVFLEDTKETTLGSSGHAIELKVSRHPDSKEMKVVLVEENEQCYGHLKNVLARRWPSIPIVNVEKVTNENNTNIFLIRQGLTQAIKSIGNIPNLGNSLFFFDPLRNVSYSAIDTVASSRIKHFLQCGTEFLIFVFTSDWFLGRKDFSPLPNTTEEAKWSEGERKTVALADDFFGARLWRKFLLNNNSISQREHMLIRLYKYRLLKWFRYTLVLPFQPKKGQTYHIILCSNYETGVRATRNFYCSKTNNEKYSPDNRSAYEQFKSLHPELFKNIRGNARPLEWKMLWKIIVEHEEGVCDLLCPDFRELEGDVQKISQTLVWLRSKGYIRELRVPHAWSAQRYRRYWLNWSTIVKNLKINPPQPLIPLTPKE